MTLQSALPSPPSSAKNFFGKVVFKVGSVGKDIFVDIAVGVISTADTTDNAVNSVKFVNVAAYTITSVNRKFVTANFVDIEANTIYFVANSFGDYCSITDSSFRDTAIPVNSVESSFHKYNKVEKSVFVETSAAEHLVGASDLVESAINSISFVGASFSDYCPLECHLYTGCFVLISASASNALNNRQNKYQTFFEISIECLAVLDVAILAVGDSCVAVGANQNYIVGRNKNIVVRTTVEGYSVADLAVRNKFVVSPSTYFVES